MINIGAKELIIRILELDDKCEFWCVDGVKCASRQQNSHTCTKDCGIGCGIRKELLRKNK
jgi:hypothetical protein